MSKYTQLEKFPKWQIEKARWSLFSELIQIENNPDLDLDPQVQKFTKSIISAASKSIPKSSSKLPKKVVPWWCDELKQAIKMRKKTICKFKKNLTHENLINFKQKRASASHLNLSKQRDS